MNRLGQVFLTTLALLSLGFAQEWQGTVVFVNGKVLVCHAGHSPKILKNEMHIGQGDTIRTTAQSYVNLQFPDASQITIKENTVSVLSQSLAQNQGTQVQWNLSTGKLFFKITPLNNEHSSYQFATPTATAAIRGTQGEIETDGSRTLAWLKEGHLELAALNETDPNKHIHIYANQIAEHDKDHWQTIKEVEPTKIEQELQKIRERWEQDSDKKTDLNDKIREKKELLHFKATENNHSTP